MEFCYSDDAERFYGTCPSLEHAVTEALDSYRDKDFIYVGRANRRTIGGFFSELDVEQMLEGIALQAYDDCGEVAEDWLVMPTAPKISGESAVERSKKNSKLVAQYLDELTEEIRASLEKWATKNDEQPHFWSVEGVRCYTREEAEAILAEPHH